MKKVFNSILAGCAMMMVFSCNNDDDNPATNGSETIYDLASADPELSSLKAALDKAGLSETLDEQGTYTVFAPSNAAFASFLQANGFSNLNEVPDEVLRKILLNHVLGSEVPSSQVTTGYVPTLATSAAANRNLSMYINTESGVRINGVSNVTDVDIDATNGVIHKVDAVIGLPSIVTHAVANPEFSNLVAALTRDDMPDFVSVLSGTTNSPFTVFAPNNAAFASLLSELGLSGLGDIPQETLQNVLAYHVVAGANVASSDISNNMSVTTLQGGTFTITTDGGVKITDANGRVANVIFTDVQCDNGVIHVIDKVILPAMSNMPETIYELAAADADLSSLKAAIDRAGLSEVLNGDGTFTVFAPSNAGFASFLQANGFGNLNDVPVDVLRKVLLNHVLGAEVPSSSVSTGYVSTLAMSAAANRNLSMYINTQSGVKINGVSNVTAVDIEATNGVIHKVDAVIGLPTIVTHAVANPNFSNLVAALTRDDMPDFVSILSGTANSPFTVFAPDNAAFGSLLTELGLGGLGDIPQATLENVLKYHVVAGANVASTDITNNMVVTTFQGGTFTITTNGGVKITDANGRMSNVVATDVQCDNGIIHVIDKVILP